MRLGYGLCLSILMHYAQNALKELKKKNCERTMSDLLRKKDTYFPIVLAEFAEAYAFYLTLEHGVLDKKAFFNHILTDKTAYKEGTPQYQWREMFLDVCALAQKLDPTFQLSL